jgi:hypothetical protein
LSWFRSEPAVAGTARTRSTSTPGRSRYVGAVSLGHGGDGKRVRRTVYGKAKQDVRLKLKSLRSGIEAGVRAPASYTVRATVDDWLAQGLSGRSERTLALYRDGVKPLTDRIGARQR